MSNWQDYVNNKYKKKDEKQSYAEHVQEKYGNVSGAKEETVKTAAPSAPKYVGWGSKAQPNSIKRTEAKKPSEFERRQTILAAEDQYHSEAIRRLRQGMGEFQQEDRQTVGPMLKNAPQTYGGIPKNTMERALETLNPIPGLNADWRTRALDMADEAVRNRRDFYGEFSRPEEYAEYLKDKDEQAAEDALAAIRENRTIEVDGEQIPVDELRKRTEDMKASSMVFRTPEEEKAYNFKIWENERMLEEDERWAQREEEEQIKKNQAAQSQHALEYAKEAPYLPDFQQVSQAGGTGTKAKRTEEEREKAELQAAMNEASGYGAGKTWDEQWLIDDYISDEDLATYNYLVNKSMNEYADAFWKDVVQKAEQKQTEDRVGYVRDVVSHAPYGLGRDAAGSALSVAANFGNAIQGGYYLGKNAAGKLAGSGEEIDPYNAAFGGGYIRDALRGDVMQGMGPVGRFLYQTGMSVMDSTLGATLLGGTGGAALLASGAMTDTAKDAKLNGATDGQAMALGLASGLSELVTEKIGFDRLGNMIGGNRGNVFREILGHMASEFGEEGATEIANIVTDALVMADKSEWADLVAQYGEKRALQEMLGRIGLAGLGGALSGAAMGGGASAIGAIDQAVQRRGDQKVADLLGATDILSDGARGGGIAYGPVQTIEQLAQEAADAEMAEERGEAAPVQAAPVSRETISREVPAAPVRAEAAVSQDASTVQRSMPETQVEQAARRIENEASKRQFVQAAEKYGEAGTVFAHNYEGGDIATYEKAFSHLYSAGQTNLPLERIAGVTDALTAGMSESAKQAIWQAGRNADVKNIKAGVQMRTTVKLSDRQKRQFKMLDEMAKRFDYEIDIVDSIAGGMANGAYTGGRRIVVAADAAEEAIVQTGVHELVHGLKANDDAGYRVLEEVVLKHLQSEDSLFDLEYAIGARIKEYANGGQTLTRDAAIEEIVCEAVPTFLTDEAAVKAFVRDNGTLAAKIRDFFINFAKEIREIAMRYMQRDGMDRDEIANLLGRSDALTEIAQTFDRAMEAAGEKNENPQKEHRMDADSEDGVKYSKVKSFADQLKQLREGAFPRNDHLYVMDTPEVLQKIGLKDLPILMTQRHAKSVMKVSGPDSKANYHGLTIAMMRQLPEAIANPAMIIRAHDYDGRVIVITTLKDDAGDTVIAPIEMDGKGNWQNAEIDANILMTAYGKQRLKDMLINAVMNNEVLFMDKKRSDALGKTVGVQFPKNLTSGGFIHSISDFVPDVNDQTKFSINSDAFRNWFGESKIVNEDGSPKVMYHGTDAYKEFTVFKKGKRGWLGPGIYLSASQSVAENYAKKNGYDGRTYALYAKVENPLIVTEGNPVPEVLRAVSGGDRLYNSRSAKQTNDVHLITTADIKKLQTKGYDGIIWKFGKGPIEVSVFSPDQIKSATDNVGTFDPENPDIRFSLNNTAPIESVMADDQNLMLPADVDVREESIKGVAASALSRGINERMDQQITGVANKILKETGSTYAKADIIANMKSLIDEYAANGATEETLRAVAEMAKKIIESSSRADNTLREQYADLRKKLRETGISLTETQKQEAANEAGSYNAYRQSLMGTVKLTNDGISLDAIWGELSSQNPEVFPPDTGEAEMVGRLTDFMMLMKPKYENPYGMDMDGAALEMAMRIQADLMGILGARDAAKAMYGTAEKFRKQYEAEFKVKLAQQKKERVEKFQKIASELKEAKAKGDSAEQAKIMNRYRAALKATALDEAYAEVRATYKEREAQKAENRKANELRGRVAKQAGELMNMFARPEKGKRIPTGLQGLVLDVLETLDINGEHAAAAGKETKKAAEFREKLTGIRSFYEQVINSQSKGEAPEGMDGLMMAFTERNMAAMNEALDILGGGDKFRLRDMNSEQLKMLDELLKNIKHTVESVGKLWKIHRYQSVVELGNASIEEMDERGQQKIDAGSTAGKARDFLALDMLEPVSYGERLGEGGSVIIQGLMDGEKIKFGKIRDAAEATGKMLKDTKVTGYDIGKWRRNVHTVKLGSGKVVKMSDVNIMELYLTAKRPQGLQHLLANGMKIQSKEAGQQPRHIELTQADITDISGMLSEKQKKIADLMQAYLSGEVAKWGNDVTQRLYLYDAFAEQTYWPISSDPNSLKTQEPEADRAFTAITNAGFTKPLNVKATNPIIIGDAFETFGRHIGEMASYAGYAEVMTDTLAWINYRQRSDDGRLSGSVKESIETLLGNGGIKYLTKLVQDINGARRGGDGMQIANALLRNYKANAVIGKIRVAIQQPTSIVRAAAEINPAYLLTGLKAGKGAVQEMQKWSNLAWWKSNGYYDIGVGKSTDEIFWGETSLLDHAKDTAAKIGALGMDPGKMDDWAWARIWSAAKREIRRTRSDLAYRSEEYFKAVAERFEYIVDRTQVVDTVMHRSDLMRGKDGLIQSLTAFKSEPTKSYNMLMRAIMEASRNPKDKKAYARLMRTTGAFAASAAATAAATALFDAFKNRDDEDDLWTYLTEGEFWKDYAEAWLDGFVGNINIASSIPLVGEAIEAIQGSDVTMMQFEGLGNIANAATTFMDHFFGGNEKKTTKWGAMKPAITTISQLAGLPASGMIANSEMLVRIYDPKLMQTKSEIAKLNDAYRVMYEAIAAGDNKKALSIRGQLAKGLHGATPKNPKEIDTGIAHALAENDERVMKAYELREKGNSTKQVLALKKQIMADGFTDAQVTAAINYCETLLNAEESEKDMTAQLTAKMFTKNHLYSAVRNGSIEDVAAIAEYLENVSSAKDPAKSIMSDVSGEFRQEYLELIGSGKTAQAAALAKKLAAVDIDEETIAGWVKDGRYDSMKEAVAAGDAKEAGRIVRQLTESGATASGIVSSLNSRFQEQYVEYMRSGKRTQAKRLMEVLQGLGLYWKDGKTNYYRDEVFEEWLEDSE